MPLLAHSQMPVWTNRYNGSGNGDDIAVAMALDAQGNVIVTGRSVGTGSADPHYATIKYSSASTALWTNRYEGPVSGWDQPTALAVDGSGNVYVTGFSRTAFFSDDFDYATIKYSSAGVPLWTNRHVGPANLDQAEALAVDSSGNVFVTGYSVGSGTGPDYATIAYSSAGVPLWTNRFSAPNVSGNDRAYAIGVDNNGNVFVTGWSYDSNAVPGYATLGYSKDGATLWTNRFEPVGSTSFLAPAMAVSPNGHVYVTAASWNGTNDDFVTISYSSAGVPLWTNRYGGSGNAADQPKAIALDANGNVIVTGHSSTGIRSVVATIAYSSAGLPLWTNRFDRHGGLGASGGEALATDTNGNVYVTGSSVLIDASGSHPSYSILAFSSTGVLLWNNNYDGLASGDRPALAVKVDNSGNLYAAGYSWNGTNYDYATTKYIAVPILNINAARPTAQYPVTNGAGYTVSVVTNIISGATNVEHRCAFGGHHFLSVVDAAGAFVFRPHPGVDRNGWGSSLYLQPFLPGATLQHTTISNVTAVAGGISVAAGGSVARGSDQTFGSWTATLTFTYEPDTKKAHGSGEYAVNLSGNLSSDTGDLNLYKLASSYLRNVPLLNGTTNDTGDIFHAVVSGSGFPTFTWIPWQMPGHFPNDTTDSLTVDVVGDYNSVDTASQGFCPIQAAWKPSFQVALTSHQAGIPMVFGGIYDETKAQLFYEDNVGITPLVLRSSPDLNFAFAVGLESSALAGDGLGVEAELTATYSGSAENALEVFFAESVQGPYRQFVGTLPMASSSVFGGTIAVTRPPGGQPVPTNGFCKARTPCSVTP
jgi:hypothetical protein